MARLVPSVTRAALALGAACACAAFTLVPTIAPLPVPTAAQLRYQGSINALIHFGMSTFFHGAHTWVVGISQPACDRPAAARRAPKPAPHVRVGARLSGWVVVPMRHSARVSPLLPTDGDPGCDSNNWNGCDPNGGCNSSRPTSFAPTALNVSSWVDSMVALGATSAVLTAKHGCGFLAWEPEATLPDGSPYTYHVPADKPVARLFVDAMKERNLGYGFYYSLTNNFYLNVASHNVRPPSTLLPGQVAVTQSQFEALALAHVKELWTNFGNLTEVCVCLCVCLSVCLCVCVCVCAWYG